MRAERAVCHLRREAGENRPYRSQGDTGLLPPCLTVRGFVGCGKESLGSSSTGDQTWQGMKEKDCTVQAGSGFTHVGCRAQEGFKQV